jgi:hypothetical protein
MEQPSYNEGDRVRIVQANPSTSVGETGVIFKVKRDASGTIIALDIMLDDEPKTKRGTTVYPREVELMQTRAERDSDSV